MMQLKKIIPLLLFLIPVGLHAQNVQISGHVSGFAPKSLVRVLVYADQFSQLKKTLATTQTDSTGNFHLSLPVRAVTYAMLDRKSTRLNSSHIPLSRMPSSA